MNKNPLDSRRFIQEINQTPEFLDNLPRTPRSEMSSEALRGARINAIGQGASALAIRYDQNEMRDPNGELNSHLYNMIATVNDFYEAQQSADAFRKRYGHTKFRNINRPEVDAFKSDKQTITEFNHLLTEIINLGAEKFSFNELLTFMTQQYAASSGETNTRKFQGKAFSAIDGMRNEFNVEQLLIKNDIEFKKGTIAQDAQGGDIFVNRTPIDLKSSWMSAERAKIAAQEQGYNPNRIIWSGIEFEDFEGQLLLPAHTEARVMKRLIPAINKAAGTDYQAIAS